MCVKLRIGGMDSIEETFIWNYTMRGCEEEMRNYTRDTWETSSTPRVLWLAAFVVDNDCRINQRLWLRWSTG
jgi:hypothetical protein